MSVMPKNALSEILKQSVLADSRISGLSDDIRTDIIGPAVENFVLGNEDQDSKLATFIQNIQSALETRFDPKNAQMKTLVIQDALLNANYKFEMAVSF